MNSEPTYHSAVHAKPGVVVAIGVMTLVNGIINILVALGLTGSVAVVCGKTTFNRGCPKCGA